MDADWSVELGAHDAALEFPWSSPDGSQHYIDLQSHPEQLSGIPDAVRIRELGEFLLAINRLSSPWLTAKCDVWLDDELGEAETIYETTLKLCSYVDLIAGDDAARFSFGRHEAWVRMAAGALSSAGSPPSACEFIVRRCWYHQPSQLAQTTGQSATTLTNCDPVPGFYVTFYLFGYGNDETEARTRWAEGLRRVTGVLTAP